MEDEVAANRPPNGLGSPSVTDNKGAALVSHLYMRTHLMPDSDSVQRDQYCKTCDGWSNRLTAQQSP